MNTDSLFKILLADDDPDDRELFTEAAQCHNAAVESVPNGTQLMDALTQSQTLPHFILLDLNMPEKTGKECLQEIRQHRRYNEVPVIIYSTSSNQKDIDETFAMGANLYITKPNSFSDLKNTIKNLLELNQDAVQGVERETFVYSG